MSFPPCIRTVLTRTTYLIYHFAFFFIFIEKDMSTEETASETTVPQPFVHTPKPGHYGNLNEMQTAALASMREAIPSEYAAGTDEYEMLRFLRARKFVVEDAVAMFTSYKKWYTEKKIANILDKNPENVELIVKLIPNAHFGYDLEGHPVYIERTGSIDPEVFMSNFSDNQILISHIWGQEHQIRRCKEFCESHDLPIGSIDKFSTIMDLAGLGLQHKDCLKFTKLITENDTKFYPERMAYTFIVNPTMMFKVFWNMAKLWLDPATKAKIIVCNDHSELLKYISADQLPTRYGGTAEVAGLEDPDIPAIRADLKANNPFEAMYKEKEVSAGNKLTFEIPLEAGQSCSWSYKTSHAMVFAANFYNENQTIPEVPSTDSSHSVIVNNKASVNSHDLPQQARFDAEEKGSLVLVWENDSWWGVKNVYYHVEGLVESE